MKRTNIPYQPTPTTRYCTGTARKAQKSARWSAARVSMRVTNSLSAQKLRKAKKTRETRESTRMAAKNTPAITHHDWILALSSLKSFDGRARRRKTTRTEAATRMAAVTAAIVTIG